MTPVAFLFIARFLIGDPLAVGLGQLVVAGNDGKEKQGNQ